MVVNVKALGLVSGAVVAAVAVTGFNAWRYVSDEDLLNAALSDHCIPYIITDEPPFKDMGRSAGVYDNVDRDARITGGGTSIIFEDRFIASWGDIQDPPVRVCRLEARPYGAFKIEDKGFVDRMTAAMAPLGDMRADVELSNGGVESDVEYETIGWFEADKAEDRGNRVVITLIQSQVPTVTVIGDLADP